MGTLIQEVLNNLSPYDMRVEDKRMWFHSAINDLDSHHRDHCSSYRNITTKLMYPKGNGYLEDIPLLPVQLFKSMKLSSIEGEQVYKILKSSGTTSQTPSQIILDKETAILQTKSLANIVTSFIGKKRLPMVIIDTKAVLKDPKSYSARGAGIIGYSNFGRDHLYLLDEQMNVKWDELQQFLDSHRNEKILLFGFTFMVWKYLYLEAVNRKINVDFGESVLIHGGGWKKMLDQQVSPDDFRKSLRDQLGIRSVHNYYGMVEQVGSVFFECSEGYYHAPNFADIIIRNINDFSVAPRNQEGLIQVLSLLPRSYPGHSILTEDIGTIHGEDDCQCGRGGKYFTVQGRMEQAELRGCSDTYTQV